MKSAFRAICLALCTTVCATEIHVGNDQQLRRALSEVKDHTTLRIAPGMYGGGHQVRGVEGLKIIALDPAQPPHFKGGRTALHFSRCPKLHLSHLRVSGQSIHGINVDDGGVDQPLVGGITLEHLHVSDIGPQGNYDGIKCSGLAELTIQDCKIEGWGGQAIDFVGCHQAVIRRCELVGKAGFSATAGIQLKGGCSSIIVEDCRFLNAGSRPINAGGSTGLAYFRPQGAMHEAKDITIRNNFIEGSDCAIAFVGVDGALFENNQIRHPSRWLIRILQETTGAGFVPCRNGVIKGNTFRFKRSQIQSDINIGPGTAAETFRFSNNRWLAEDAPAQSKPTLPVVENGGVYGNEHE
jgi:hypothetical protein